MNEPMDAALPPDLDLAADSVWARVPNGYAALPLEQIDETMAVVGMALDELAPDSLRPVAAPVIEALGLYLSELANRRVVYCGFGRHRSTVDEDMTLTSVLTLSLQQMPQRRNPRLALKDLVETMAAAGEHGAPEIADLPNGPVLFLERTNTFAMDDSVEDAEQGGASNAKVYQLRAYVVSADGTQLAVAELSTPFVEHGPEFRTILVAFALSISFEPPVEAPDTSGWSALLGG